MARKRLACSVLCAAFIALVLENAVSGEVVQIFSTHRVRPSSKAQWNLDSHHPGLSLKSLARHAGLGPRDGFRQTNGLVFQTAKGTKRTRLTQTYAGLDVFGSVAEAEIDDADDFTGHMYGKIARNLHKHIPDPDACQRNIRTLQNMAIRLERLSTKDSRITKRDGRRIVYAGTETIKPRLVYKVEFLYIGNGNMKRPVYFFDACTTAVLSTYDQVGRVGVPKLSDKQKIQQKKDTRASIASLKHLPYIGCCSVNASGLGGNEKIGKSTYNEAPFCLDVQMVNSTHCRMHGVHVKVVDNEGTERMDKQDVIEFDCASGYSDDINGGHGIANDAFYHGEAFGRLFKTKYNIKVLDYTPRLVVHFGELVQDAYVIDKDIFCGDGKDIFHPFVDIDSIAHLLAHGIIKLHSDLPLTGISGGILRAFSDITAVVTRRFIRGTNNWLISHDIIKVGVNVEALRFFDDPGKDGRSIRWAHQYRPGMDPHYISGVFRHAFYRMVKIEGMDIYEAYKCFLDANLNIWAGTTRFTAGACGVIQAAYENGFDHRKVRRAFLRVGIPYVFCRLTSLTTTMFPGETRREILVSATRSPILKVELDPRASNSTSVRVTADDNSEIQVLVGKDDEASQVITSGNNAVRFGNSRPHVYIKLVSGNPREVKVTMKTDH